MIKSRFMRHPVLWGAGALGVFLLAAYLVLGWWLVPSLLRSEVPRWLEARTGHRLTIARASFNPLLLDLRLDGLQLQRPDGQALLAFDQLRIDLSASSLWRRAWVLDVIGLERPTLSVHLGPGGRLNWADLVDALSGPPKAKAEEARPATPWPRVDIERLTLRGGAVEFADAPRDFHSRVQDLDLELAHVSTLPDAQGRYSISARTNAGATLALQAEGALQPLAIKGHIAVDHVDLARFAPYEGASWPVALSSGLAGLSADYGVHYEGGHWGADVTALQLTLQGLDLRAREGLQVALREARVQNGRFSWPQQSLRLDDIALQGLTLDGRSPAGQGGAQDGARTLKLLRVDGVRLERNSADLIAHRVALDAVVLQGGQLQAKHLAQGPIDVVQALMASLPPAPAQRVAPAPDPWRFHIGQVRLAQWQASYTDEATQPAASLGVQDLSARIDDVSDDLGAPLKVQASFSVRSGGRFEASGRVIPQGPAADLRFSLAGVDLRPTQPYLSAYARLALASGRLDVGGRLRYDAQGLNYQGTATLADLRLTEADGGALFLACKGLGLQGLALTPASLDIDEVRVQGLDTRLMIARDRTVNLTRILPARPHPAPAQPGAAPVAPKDDAKGKTPFNVHVERVRIQDGAMDFADESLALPFAVRIHDLHGSVNGLSTQRGAPGQLEIDGQVDDYGEAHAVGQINLADPGEYTDIQVQFRNVEMTRLTPYLATFAGRRIDSGKLSLDLQYQVNKRQLAGNNQVLIDRLTLGERVESPRARDLPLDLAIAILEDSDGQIELGLPVSGSLDDPDFSYGGIVWKALLNVIGKIATAPFRALGALFGSDDKVESLGFASGATSLAPPEREKALRLAQMLKKRPALALKLRGTWAAIDRVALQDAQVRRAVALRTGQKLVPGEDPGPLSTRDTRVQSALEALYAERFGDAELASLRAGYRQANPGQQDEGLAGRMLSRLSGAFRTVRPLDPADVAKLQGTDFHAVLFDRLREQEPVADDVLVALARQRAQSVMAVLEGAGVVASRLGQDDPAQVDVSAAPVPLGLSLGRAGAQ